MKSTVEHLSPTRVRLAIEVPFDELKPTFDQAYKKIAQQVRIPGFRPGKAPARIIDQRIGRGVVIQEVVETAIPEKYGEAVTEAQVTPLGQPDIDPGSLRIDDGEQIAFVAEVDVRPEITLPDYSSIAVSVDSAEVTDADVEDQLTGLQARFGTLTGVQRPAAKDDFVVIDLSATVNGEAVEEAQTTGMSHQVGSGQLIEGLDEALEGMSAGETKQFTTTLVAGDHAGEQAEVTVTVQTVKERQLPEADDEFAQLASEFDTLDELKADLRERHGRVKKMEQAGAGARQGARGAARGGRCSRARVGRRAGGRGARPRGRARVRPRRGAAHASTSSPQGQTREEFDTELRTNAEQAVKTQLLLDEIAEKSEVQVDQQELMERIFMQAQRFGISPEEYIQQAQQANQLGAIFADVRRGKALATVVQAATITGRTATRSTSPSCSATAGADGDDTDEADAEAAAEVADETAIAASGADQASDDAVVAPDEAAPRPSASSAPQA